MNLHVHALDHLHVVKALAQARDLDDILSPYPLTAFVYLENKYSLYSNLCG